MEDPTTQVVRLAFFKWVWQPNQSLRVTGSSKDDKSWIDIFMWVFGGDNAEMEISQFNIRNPLLRCWK